MFLGPAILTSLLIAATPAPADTLSAAVVHQAAGLTEARGGRYQTALGNFEAGLQLLEPSAKQKKPPVPAAAGRRGGHSRARPHMHVKEHNRGRELAAIAADLYLVEPAEGLATRTSAADELIAAMANNAGNMYLRQRQFKQAAKRYDQAYRAAERVGSTGRDAAAHIRANQAWLALERGDTAEANRLLEELLSPSAGDPRVDLAPMRSAVLAWAAAGARDGKDPAAALARYEKALELYQRAGDKTGYGRALAETGGARLRAGQVQPAIETFLRTLRAAADDNEAVWRAHLGLGQAHRAQGKHRLAMSHFGDYLRVVEAMAGGFATDQGRFSSLERHRVHFDEGVATALELAKAKPSAAMAARLYVERVRRRSLPSLMTTRASSTAPAPGHLPAEHALVRSAHRLDVLSPADARAPSPMAMDRMQIADGAFAGPVGDPGKPLMVDVPGPSQRGRIAGGSDAWFIEYFVLEDQVGAFVISPTGEVTHHTLPIGAAALRDRVIAYRGALGLATPDEVARAGPDRSRVVGAAASVAAGTATADPRGSLAKLSRELYATLVAPVIEGVPAGQLVTLVPHRSLWHLPFAALEDGAGHPLVQRHPLGYAVSRASTAWLAARDRPDRSKARTLLMASPTVQTTQGCNMLEDVHWTPLPGAAAEVTEIAALLDPARTVVLTGSEATAMRLDAWHGDFGVIHLATHGVVCPRRALESFVLLQPVEASTWAARKDGANLVLTSRGSPAVLPVTVTDIEDPTSEWAPAYGARLTARTVLDRFRIAADLVVLSACQTALGQVSSEGVVGFTRAFLAAGARSLLVSQWSVPDASTRTLMVRFYAEYLAHGDKARALREAMLHVRKTNPDPRQWAAFTLLGLAE